MPQAIIPQWVYLVGPITGCSYDDCTDWRDGVKARLESTGIYRCLSPMRGKGHLKDHSDLPGVIPEHICRPGCTGHDILARDFYDCNRSNVLFCNLLGAGIASIGSCYELAWGYANRCRQQVVVILDPQDEDNPHNHAFVHEAAGIILPTVDEGVEYLTEVLNS
jgi:hypothetical protein